MSVARKLERLARLIPGVGGYQDREGAREGDRLVRLRLATGLEQVKRDVEQLQTRFAQQRDLSLLPAVGRVGQKLDQAIQVVKFAARGYRALFDLQAIDDDALARLCAFDERLLDEVHALEVRSAALLDAPPAAAPGDDVTALEGAVDAFIARYRARADIVTPAVE